MCPRKVKTVDPAKPIQAQIAPAALIKNTSFSINLMQHSKTDQQLFSDDHQQVHP